MIIFLFFIFFKDFNEFESILQNIQKQLDFIRPHSLFFEEVIHYLFKITIDRTFKFYLISIINLYFHFEMIFSF